MSEKKIGVLAGTPVDTEMGVRLVGRWGYEGLPAATAGNPAEQAYYQMFDRARLQALCLEKIRALTAMGAAAALIYCNSLSCALDLPALRQASPVPVVTPLEAYEKIAPEYEHVGIIAANGQSLHGLEAVFYRARPAIRVSGASLLTIVNGIEAGRPPARLVEGEGLREVCLGLLKTGALCIVLGCTHFGYFRAELAGSLPAPVLDPDDLMRDILRETLVVCVS
ncbi:MAG: aspartate/glutamate racemase family protein [Peptococcaceae bacterium]|jgi:glutamate racemase|nr:aspartate/glutamate racemase family protein [Peptococcaceae bacterium]